MRSQGITGSSNLFGWVVLGPDGEPEYRSGWAFTPHDERVLFATSVAAHRAPRQPSAPPSADHLAEGGAWPLRQSLEREAVWKA